MLHPVFAFIIAFIIGYLTDFVWSMWAISTHKKRAVASANFSVLIYIFGMFYTLFIIEKSLIPILGYIMGGWIGTFLTVRNQNVQ